jgi:hypothetical protein
MESEFVSEGSKWKESEYAQDSFGLFLLHKKLDKLFDDFSSEDPNDWEMYAQVYQAKDLGELGKQVKARLRYEAKTFHCSLTQDPRFVVSMIDKIDVISLKDDCKSIKDIVQLFLGNKATEAPISERTQKLEDDFIRLVGPYSLTRLQNHFDRLKIDFPFDDLYILEGLFAAFAEDKAILIGWGTNE